MFLKRLVLVCTSLVTLTCTALGVAASNERLPKSIPEDNVHFERQTSGVEQMVTPETARGGRGPEHCALSVGIFLGGALGFFANPFLGTAVMRLGFMAAALHCV